MFPVQANGYSFIDDLPRGWADWRSDELPMLAQAWQNRNEQISSTDAAESYRRRISRLWAIEAGALEELYTIPRGITETLLLSGFKASLIPYDEDSKDPELIVRYLNAHEAGLETVFSFVKDDRKLSNSYIWELHSLLLREQDTTRARNQFGVMEDIPLLKGQWKKLPNNPRRADGELHHYCPPEHVSAEMDKLIELHRQHLERFVSPEIEAAWFHHRFTQIHPFQDGNGRVARALASLILIRAGWFPLVHLNRGAYITSLEQADAGDLQGLVRIIIQSERKSFLDAFAVEPELAPAPINADHVATRDLVNSITAGICSKLANLSKLEKWDSLQSHITNIKAVAISSLSVYANLIDLQLKQIDANYAASVEQSGERDNLDYQMDIRQVGQQQAYFTDIFQHCSWIRLRIEEKRRTEIVIHFHSFGVRPVGVWAASGFILFRDSEPFYHALRVDGPYALSNEIFLFAFDQDTKELQVRFTTWLNKIVQDAMWQWNRRC